MIRRLHKDDVPKVLAIEKAVHVVPWTKEIFHICLNDHYHGWVYEETNHIIGFAIASIIKEECHIVNVAVMRDHQRLGVGKTLLAEVLKHAKAQGAQMAYLEVRQTNIPAINLYKQLNFIQVGRRIGYYPAFPGREDALVFVKNLYL